MKDKFPFLFFSLVSCILCLASSCTPELSVPEPSAGDANFSKTIAIGGNYLAGYQDGALYRKGQILSIPGLLAQQFKLVGGSSFNQALMPDENGLGLNSKSWESWFIAASHLNYKTDCKGISALAPIKDSIAVASASPYLIGVAGNSIQNLSVPYANIADYFNPAFGNAFSPTGNKNPYYNRIASNPGVSTLYNDIVTQNATFVTAWLGMEDIYNFAAAGGTSASIPSAAVFSMYLDSILLGVTANGAKGVIANIPDFRSYPYYTLVKWDNAEITRQSLCDTLNNIFDTLGGLPNIHFSVGRNGFVIENPEYPGTSLYNYRQLQVGEFLTLSVPLDSMKCEGYGITGVPINDRYALDSAEILEIDNAINSYNAVIAQKAAQYNFGVVDMHYYFGTVLSGIKWDGVDFNAEFVSGGFFSLDGYHPNQKGYALIANEFIRTINNTYHAVIPTINCTDCTGVIFP